MAHNDDENRVRSQVKLGGTDSNSVTGWPAQTTLLHTSLGLERQNLTKAVFWSAFPVSE